MSPPTMVSRSESLIQFHSGTGAELYMTNATNSTSAPIPEIMYALLCFMVSPLPDCGEHGVIPARWFTAPHCSEAALERAAALRRA